MILVLALVVLTCAQETAPPPPFVFELEPRGMDVAFTIQNTQRTPLTLLRWNTPLDINTPFRSNMFRIRGETEDPVYAGAYLKRVVLAEDLIYLEGGQAARGAVNLANGYYIPNRGTYEASLDTSILIYNGIASERILASEYPLRDFIEYPLISNSSFRFETEGQAKQPIWWDPPGGDDIPDPTTKPAVVYPKTYNCNASQVNLIHSACSSCKTYAYAAQTYMAIGYNAPANRYKQWFGTYTANRWATVKAHYDAIKTRTKDATYQVDCYCEQQYWGAYAYVYGGTCCRVHVCSLFWAAPNTGTDSRAGTLIHELSHFNVVADTDDWVYGQAGCKSLASSNPNNAIKNADSHEYFAENTPVLT